jgi:hypothetical protein
MFDSYYYGLIVQFKFRELTCEGARNTFREFSIVLRSSNTFSVLRPKLLLATVA